MYKIENLPKWAQDKIKVAECDKAYLEKQIKEILGTDEESNVSRQTGLEKVNLPKDSTIYFSISGGRISARVIRLDEETGLYINLNAGERLAFCPEAANAGVIIVKKD